MTEHTTKPPGIELIDILDITIARHNDAMYGTMYYYVVTYNGGAQTKVFEVRLNRANGQLIIRQFGKDGKRLEELTPLDKQIRKQHDLRVACNGKRVPNDGAMHIVQIVQSPHWFATRNDLAFGAMLPHLYTDGVRKFFEAIEGRTPPPKLREIHAVGRLTTGQRASASKFYYVVCEGNGRSTYRTEVVTWNAAAGCFRIDYDPALPMLVLDPSIPLAVGQPFCYFQDRHGHKSRKSQKTILHIVESDQKVELRTIRQITGIGLYKPQP